MPTNPRKGLAGHMSSYLVRHAMPASLVEVMPLAFVAYIRSKVLAAIAGDSEMYKPHTCSDVLIIIVCAEHAYKS